MFPPTQGLAGFTAIMIFNILAEMLLDFAATDGLILGKLLRGHNDSSFVSVQCGGGIMGPREAAPMIIQVRLECF